MPLGPSAAGTTSGPHRVLISVDDQKLYEDETVNRMQEAMTLFESVANSRSVNNPPIRAMHNTTVLVQFGTVSPRRTVSPRIASYRIVLYPRYQSHPRLTHPGARWFTKTSIILFLNKIDLFRAKLPYSPLSETFPEYRGGANYDAACAFLLEKFVGLNKNPTKSVYAVSAAVILCSQCGTGCHTCVCSPCRPLSCLERRHAMH